ncbi:hypothetical protein DFH06DRAFT_293437 [Mycena polygramma]|nr:hypothetical protein DFH06DRAFT_293437 [Mycena polygramma]
MSPLNLAPWASRLNDLRLTARQSPIECHSYLLDPTIEPQSHFRKEFRRLIILPPIFYEYRHLWRSPRTFYGFLCPFPFAVQALTRIGVSGVDSTNIFRILPRFINHALRTLWPEALHGSVIYDFGLHAGGLVPVLAVLDSRNVKGQIPIHAIAAVAAILGKLEDLDDLDNFPYHYVADTCWLWEPINHTNIVPSRPRVRSK